LDVIVSESEASRAASEVLAEEGNIAGARQELARVLGFSSGAALDIEGDLADRSVLETHVDSTAPEDRADVLAAKSEVASASAAVSSARAEWVPELAFRMDYERTDNEELLRPGIELSLPLFNRGQGARGEAKARRERALIQLESQRAAALAEVEGTRSSYRSAVASTREIQTDALPRALEIESLVTEAYAAGKIDLPSLILVRSNALDTRREHADRLFEAALRGIDFAMAAGAFR
jgi:cobalt-zinc-cadmium efflux system outer membrane protein